MIDEKRKIRNSLLVPSIFIIAIWLVKLTEVVFQTDLGEYGLQPLHWKGLAGIVTSPFLHADFSHLMANTFPLFVLLALLFYFYRVIAWPVLLYTWFLTGLWVWLFAREDSVHIGASGIIYGLAAFLFLSGIIRRESRLMAITLLTAFLYGGMVWGVFPQFFPRQPISWESHLMGILAGVILAIFYRKAGPQRKVYDWDEDDEDDDPSAYQDDENPENSETPPAETGMQPPDPGSQPPEIRYHYKA